MSRFHFHRMFKTITGVTPKAYSNAVRRKTVREELHASASVTDAIYRSGFGSSSRFYKSSGKVLGMKPREFRSGGSGAGLGFAVAIPCHRVVRTDGSLSGYRWGIGRKRTLLGRESG